MKKIYYFFIAIFILYFLMISNTVFGGDAGDLLASILTNSPTHPPGYPLYVLINILAVRLPFSFLTTAGKVTLISAVSTALSIFMLFLIIKEIASPKYFNKYLAILTTGIISFNYLVWLYAIVPEVFPLNTLITLSLFYFAVRFYRTPKNKYLYLIFFLTGLGISHHHTFVLALPSIAYLIFQKRNKILFKFRDLWKYFLSLAVGLTPLLYLIYTAAINSELIWEKTNTIRGFFFFLFRINYGTFLAAPLILNVPQARFSQIKNLFGFTVDDFSVMGIILFILGLVFMVRLKKSLTKTLLMTVLLNIFLFGPFFVFYANFPLINSYFFATIERFLIVYYFLFAVFIYFGLYYFIYGIIGLITKKYLVNHVLKKFTFAACLMILLIYPLGLILKNYPVLHALKNDRTPENIGYDVLNNIENNSILLLASDSMIFNTQYVYYTNPQIRKNRVIIQMGKLLWTHYPYLMNLYHPGIKLSASKNNKTDAVQELIKLNKDKYAIYAENPISLGDLKDKYTWDYQGFIFKLEKKDASTEKKKVQIIKKFWVKSLNRNLAIEQEKNPLRFKNLFTGDILQSYSIAHRNSALFFLKYNELEAAYHEISEAKKLEEDSPEEIDKLLSNYYGLKGGCKKAEDAISRALSIKVNRDYLLQLIYIGDKCYKDEKNKKRIEEKINNYILKKNTPIENF